MFTTLLAAAAFIAPALLVRADFSMAGPATLNQCAEAHFTWDDTGKGPYNLVVLDSTNPCGDALLDLGDHSGTSMTWYNVTFTAGTKIQLSVEDTSYGEAWSQDYVVGSGDSSCLTPAQLAAVSSSSAAAPTSAGTTKAASTTAKAATTPAKNAGSAPSVAVAGAISGASAASFSLPALALSAVVGFFTLL